MAIIDDVKTARRISHTKLDSDIKRLIETARAELVRVGVDKDKTEGEDDSLINQAIITFCLKEMSSGDTRDKYEESWNIQCDGLRKSEAYRCTTKS